MASAVTDATLRELLACQEVEAVDLVSTSWPCTYFRFGIWDQRLYPTSHEVEFTKPYETSTLK